MKAAIYCRTDTRDLASEHHIMTQQMECKNLCKKNGWQVVGIFKDVGLSGSLYEDRPDLIELVDQIRKGQIDVVVVSDVERLARNFCVFGMIHSALDKSKVQLVTPAGGIIHRKEQTKWVVRGFEQLMVEVCARKRIEDTLINAEVEWNLIKQQG